MEIARWNLERLTSGEEAALRRAAGSGEFDAAAWRAFYRVDGGDEKGADERFAALCMSCLWRRTDEVTVKPMEECLRLLCWEDTNGEHTLKNGMAKRVDVLLDTNCSADGFFQGKLLNLVKMIRADGRYKPDFEQLAEDMRHWNSPDRWVQRRWLRTIYRNDKSDEQTEGEENHDA